VTGGEWIDEVDPEVLAAVASVESAAGLPKDVWLEPREPALTDAQYVHPTFPGRTSGFAPDGYAWAGRIGSCKHLGPPLTPEQTAALPDRAQIVVTWFGGNGPHPYVVLVDTEGQRRVEGMYCQSIPQFKGDRITLGWDDEARRRVDNRAKPSPNTRAVWDKLRHGLLGSEHVDGVGR
jgi:hypothetical protein